jgi:hypothetical protein
MTAFRGKPADLKRHGGAYETAQRDAVVMATQPHDREQHEAEQIPREHEQRRRGWTAHRLQHDLRLQRAVVAQKPDGIRADLGIEVRPDTNVERETTLV